MKINVKNSSFIRLTSIIGKNDNGDMYVAEETKNLPFKIKRVFFINRPKRKKSVLGKHAHKKTSQVIFCVNGSFVLNIDDGKVSQSIPMNDPSKGVLLGPKLWHSMANISEDCTILVLADNFYYEDDYIRNYDDFVNYIVNNKETK